MKLFQVLKTAYPRWYRVLILYLLPIVVFCLNFGAAVYIASGNEAESGISHGFMLAAYMLYFYLLIVETATDYYALGAIYARAEPFGRLILTSTRGMRYFKRFATADIVRRAVYLLITLWLPYAIMFTIAGIPWNFYIVTRLAVAIASFGVMQSTLYVLRRVQSVPLFMLTLCGAEIIYVLLMIWGADGLHGLWLLLFSLIAITFAVLGGVGTYTSTISAGKESYYDKAVF